MGGAHVGSDEGIVVVENLWVSKGFGAYAEEVVFWDLLLSMISLV